MRWRILGLHQQNFASGVDLDLLSLLCFLGHFLESDTEFEVNTPASREEDHSSYKEDAAITPIIKKLRELTIMVKGYICCTEQDFRRTGGGQGHNGQAG